jgi:Zn-dependent protease
MLFSGLDAATLIARAIVLLIAFTLHELAHALTADFLGDPTPRRMGRISLNPLVHLDPFGTIMLLISGFGWAKPVMVNPYNMRGNPHTSMAIVAAAGPITNLVLAVIGSIPFMIGWASPSFTAGTSGDFLLSQFVWINLILAFFNLIPVPPLDGYRILVGLLPFEMAIKLRPLERYGFLVLMGLIFFLPMIGIDILGTLVMQPAARVFAALVGF